MTMRGAFENWRGLVAVFWLALTMLAAPLAALAQDQNTGLSEEEAALDLQIEARLATIYDRMESLADVEVDAVGGVVILTGTVTEDGAEAKAETIASNVDGVIAVENRIARNLSLSGNIGPITAKARALWDGFIQSLPLIVLSLIFMALIISVGWWLSGRDKLWARITPNVFLAELVAQAVKLVFVILALVTVLNILGLTALLGTILGLAGVIGIAVGFAVRDTLDNYISGIMLSIRQPFRANDAVQIGEHSGRVLRLTSRATLLMTFDGNHLRIPNSTVFKSIIVNVTRIPERRFSFELGIDTDFDPLVALNLGLDTIQALDFVLDEPAPDGWVRDVGDSNVILCFQAWVNQTETNFAKARGTAIRNVKQAFDEKGIGLPEPMYRIKMDGAPVGTGEGQARKNMDKAVKNDQTLDDPQDVRADRYIEDLVDEQRAQADADLLDGKTREE